MAIYLSRYVRGGPINDRRLISSDQKGVRFRYQDHRDGKSKVMALSESNFISRVLSHVPVKGRHLVRYYGLYVSGASEKRETARKALGAEPESAYEVDKKVRCCPECGRQLSHFRSTRGKNSYIGNTQVISAYGAGVQQDVEFDRASSLGQFRPDIERPPAWSFFGVPGGELT